MRVQIAPSALSARRSMASSIRAPVAVTRASVKTHVVASDERLRLHNLSPLEGARQKKKRVGRGYGAGQGGSCGDGMRGQNARSGKGTRTGFEGGQTPMFRRFPKLKGIAGGMGAGRPKFLTVNIGDLEAAVVANKIDASAEISIETLKSAGIIKATGYYRDLPLKVLGEGELTNGLKVKAHAFSQSAAEKLAGAGGAAEVIPAKEKWSREAAAAAK